MKAAAVGVRRARARDLPRILEIERTSFPLPWSPATFRSLLDRERVLVLVAAEGARVVAHAVLWWVADEGELANLAVAPEARRQGIGSLLMDRILAEARAAGLRSIFLEVRASNLGALALYRRRGFREVGRRKDYYSRPREDALILRLEPERGGPLEPEGGRPLDQEGGGPLEPEGGRPLDQEGGRPLEPNVAEHRELPVSGDRDPEGDGPVGEPWNPDPGGPRAGGPPP
jgi:[ribosomal protein S18]-alanine N-acetyltransferase